MHTDFSRLLFHSYGVHPKTSFQVLSCLWGGLVVVLAGIRLSAWGQERQSYLSWLWFLLLIGPGHLFFGYIEWYTQLAVGLILFEIYGVSMILTGSGLTMALLGLVFAGCSHLVGFGFLPAGIVLIGITLPRRQRNEVLTVFVLVLVTAVVLTLFWVRRQIVFGHSIQATANLFSTLLPLMRADNPDNPPGSWQYPWLSLNHLVDLFNEILLCGLFPLLLLAGGCPIRRLLHQTKSALIFPSRLMGGAEQSEGRNQNGADAALADLTSKRLIVFFLPQLLLGGVFLLTWNPWLGFPGDWDLFSFFAWPLLMAALVGVASWKSGEDRRRLLWLAGLPAFSVVGAWIVFYHQGSLPTTAEAMARFTGDMANLRWEEAQAAVEKGDWPRAFEKTEAAMKEDPARIPQSLSLMGTPVIQRMSEQWPERDQVTRMACDAEIISSSPVRRLLVMDRPGTDLLVGGRVFPRLGTRGNSWTAGASCRGHGNRPLEKVGGDPAR